MSFAALRPNPVWKLTTLPGLPIWIWGGDAGQGMNIKEKYRKRKAGDLAKRRQKEQGIVPTLLFSHFQFSLAFFQW